MAKITLGGKDFETTPLNIKRLKKIWGKLAIALNQFQNGITDLDAVVDGIDAAIAVLAQALEPKHPDMTPEAIEDLMTPGDLMSLQATLTAIMSESGLKQDTPGEPQPSGENIPNPSTATGTDSSSSSSPQE